jgi:endonuclease-8
VTVPEGDTVFKAAARLRDVLVDRKIERATGSAPAVRRRADRIAAATTTSVRSYGKHLFIDFDSGLSIRTHLGMPGSWHVYRTGQQWGRPVGAARVVLVTAETESVCFAAPDVQVERRRVVDLAVADLGPDLARPEFDVGEYLSRAARFGSGRQIAEVVVDQRVLAGPGNVYKSEVLYLEKLLPQTPFADLDEAALSGLATRAHRLLRANLSDAPRSTTGDRRRGRTLWVYGRGGRPCRRCGTTIEYEQIEDRITYWCPRCQT